MLLWGFFCIFGVVSNKIWVPAFWKLFFEFGWFFVSFCRKFFFRFLLGISHTLLHSSLDRGVRWGMVIPLFSLLLYFWKYPISFCTVLWVVELAGIWSFPYCIWWDLLLVRGSLTTAWFSRSQEHGRPLLETLTPGCWLPLVCLPCLDPWRCTPLCWLPCSHRWTSGPLGAGVWCCWCCCQYLLTGCSLYPCCGGWWTWLWQPVLPELPVC